MLRSEIETLAGFKALLEVLANTRLQTDRASQLSLLQRGG